MATPNMQGWDVALAKGLGVAPTPAVIKFFHLWSQAEGGAAENNPFNTTQPGFNTVGDYNSVGVKRYGDPQSGIKATIATLKNGRYGNILSALQRGSSPLEMAQALAASPWGTGALVLKMLGQGGGSPQSPSQAPAPISGGLPGIKPIPGVGGMPNSLQALLQNAAPSALTTRLLAPLGGTAAKTAQAAQAPIPTPQPLQGLPGVPGLPGQQNQGQPQSGDAYSVPTVPIEGATHGGSVPMIFGGNITAQYPNLHVQGQADWQHINPRLLQTLQKVAEKKGVSIVIFSGYRSTDYNAKIGGAGGSNHTKGLAVDAYINGHPIGDVIPPEEWAKYGIRSGNTPGFFHGKPDPEHIDMVGIPIKGAK